MGDISSAFGLRTLSRGRTCFDFAVLPHCKYYKPLQALCTKFCFHVEAQQADLVVPFQMLLGTRQFTYTLESRRKRECVDWFEQ